MKRKNKCNFSLFLYSQFSNLSNRVERRINQKRSKRDFVRKKKLNIQLFHCRTSISWGRKMFFSILVVFRNQIFNSKLKSRQSNLFAPIKLASNKFEKTLYAEKEAKSQKKWFQMVLKQKNKEIKRKKKLEKIHLFFDLYGSSARDDLNVFDLEFAWKWFASNFIRCDMVVCNK